MHPLNLLPPSFENQTFWLLGKLKESVLFEIKDKSIRFKFFIVSLLEHNLNQQISLFIIFVLLTPHAKSTLTKVLVHLRLNLTQP